MGIAVCYSSGGVKLSRDGLWLEAGREMEMM